MVEKYGIQMNSACLPFVNAHFGTDLTKVNNLRYRYEMRYGYVEYANPLPMGMGAAALEHDEIAWGDQATATYAPSEESVESIEAKKLRDRKRLYAFENLQFPAAMIYGDPAVIGDVDLMSFISRYFYGFTIEPLECRHQAERFPVLDIPEEERMNYLVVCLTIGGINMKEDEKIQRRMLTKYGVNGNLWDRMFKRLIITNHNDYGDLVLLTHIDKPVLIRSSYCSSYEEYRVYLRRSTIPTKESHESFDFLVHKDDLKFIDSVEL